MPASSPAPPQTHPRRLGLTGSIGAGKSTVAALLRQRGLTVLDADEVAREVTRDPAVLAEIGAEFPGVVQGGELDRAELAARVFGDPAQLAVLNAVTHPRVRARMLALEREAAQRGEHWTVQDVPLLFEGGLEKQMDAVLVVDAPLETRISRVTARSGLSRGEVLARDARQMPAEEKRRRATVVLDNGGDPAALEAQVDRALGALGIQLQTASGQQEKSPSGG
ncbi:dephospho-CoA kinase [Deinococcus sp. MIMF12]|uniref:Dephospho-CoA kinase n=1 Tax=Deinococcus rhizophilus TaxID=3049544 RepID=A0ABT7JL48_9DEIO|nr:dephospho-CoA kinase [Deinococcus rhizophilus]MDL2344678.1 dephospho-CoA kinase [Deinococcus rhizophilus]